MELVKVSLTPELAMLRRLLQVGRRADNHYQQATQEYCAQLRELYRASVRERCRRAAAARRARKEASSTAIAGEIFKLTLSGAESLPGIALARSSLPQAEQGDHVQLLRLADAAPAAAASDKNTELLTRGIILLVNEQQVRIKFQEPLKLKVKVEVEEVTVSQDDTLAKVNGIENASDEILVEKDSATEEKEAKEVKKLEPQVIYFRVKFDLSATTRTGRRGDVSKDLDKVDCEDDEYGQLIEEVLRSFAKVKCNQSLHRNLMGQYDERSEVTLSDRARVLPTAALNRLRPNKQQRVAVEQALKRRLTLIEGPAGSGKTLVAALIAANACRLRGQGHVLLCSPLQSTVDRLTELLLQLLGGHQQVVKLPENASASTRNPRLARRAPSKARRSMVRANCGAGKRNSFLGQLIDVDDDEYRGDDDQDDDEEDQHQIEANRAHLDKIVDDEIYLQAYARSKDTLGHNHEQLHAHAYRMVTSCSSLKRREMEAKMISKANVICCTLVQAGSYLLKGAQFDLLILDDVQLTSELDCLVAMTMARGIKQMTLLSDTRRRIRLARSQLPGSAGAQQINVKAVAGDRRQPPPAANRTGSRNSVGNSADSLRRPKRNGRGTPRSRRTSESPTSDSESASEQTSGTARSTPPAMNGGTAAATKSRGPPAGVSLEPGNLFERLLSLGLPSVDMRVQYRCHATLSNFFNHHFYAGRLKDDRRTNGKLTAEINTSLLVHDQNFAWMPNRKYLTGLFWATKSLESENLETTTNHVLNRLLRDENIQESRIGVIYNKHSLLVKAKQSAVRQAICDLKQATIDGFIGQEKDFIILVAGVSGEDSSKEETEEEEKSHLGLTSEINCDFRSNDAALNWAITRAKLGLFIVADRAGAKEDNEPDYDCGSWRELVKYYDTNKLTTNSTPS